MAEQDVGGIGVRFTADASQLQQEIQRLEQRLRQFDSAYGQRKIRLQADLTMPGARTLADFRRGIEANFRQQGAAGGIKVPVQLLPPSAAQIRALKGQIGTIAVDVVGNFKWGIKPPKSVTVEVVETAPTGGGGRRPPITQSPASPLAATGTPRRSTVTARASRPDRVTWTQADLTNFTTAALRDQLRGERGANRTLIQNEIRRRETAGEPNTAGYTPGGYKATARGPGGARGFVAQYLGVPVPSTTATGVRPPGGAQIKAMQRAGQLPLPYAEAGLYHPALPPPKLARQPGQRAVQLPPEEWLERRLDQVLKLTPRARLRSGERWWQQAGQLIGGMAHGTGMTAPQAAGVAAQMTTRLSWPETLKAFDTFSMRIRAGLKDQADLFRGMQVMGREQRQIMAILASSGTEEAVEGIIRGPKGTNAPKLAEMYGGFLGRPNAFPFDAHMQRLLLGGEVPTRLIPQARDWAAGALRRRGHTPAALMPAIWETAGGGDVFGADPHGQLRATGGPRGYTGDAYTTNLRREQQRSLREVSKYRWPAPPSLFDDDRIRQVDLSPEATAARVSAIDAALGWKRDRGGARGYVGEANSLTWAERMNQMRPRPLQLSTRNATFPRGVEEYPVEYIDPRRLVPFRELDRERSPRMQLRGFYDRRGGAPEPWGGNYLNQLTDQVRSQGRINEPLRLEYDEAGFAQLTDGNHRLAVALRLLNEGLENFAKVPVQAVPARGLLTGNTNPLAARGATTVAGIVGGPRGFTGSPFGAPWSRSGSPQGVGLEAGDVQRRLSDDARKWAHVEEMAKRLSPDWGGFSINARSGEFLEPTPGRRQGPWLSSVGNTVRLPVNAARNPVRLQEALDALRADPLNRRLLDLPNAYIGGFHSPDRGEVDLDVSLRSERASEALRLQRARGAADRGAYNVATGNGLFGPQNVYGEPETRVPGFGQPRFVNTGRFAGRRDLAAGMAWQPARPPVSDLEDLDVPTYLRRQGKAFAEAIHQTAAMPVAAEPTRQEVELGRDTLRDLTARGPSLQETLEAGGGGRRRPPRPQAAGGAANLPDDLGDVSDIAKRARDLAASTRLAVAEARGAGQVRAVGTTTASLIANLFGGKAEREIAARDLATLATEAEHLSKQAAGAQARMASAAVEYRKATTPLERSVLADSFAEASKELDGYNQRLEEVNARSEELRNRTGRLKGAAVGFASSIAGTIAGLAIFNTVSAGIEGVGNALAGPTDRLLGFRRIGEATGLQLGQLTRQYNGLADMATSATVAQTGLGDSVTRQIRPLLQQRAIVEAGNDAFRDQLDLIHAAGFFQRNPGAGITQTTGGLLGTPIGGQQPFLEQLLQSGSPVGGPLEGPKGRSAIGGALIGAGAGMAAGATAGLLGGPFAPVTVTGGALIGGLVGAVGGLTAGGLAGAFLPSAPAGFAKRYQAGELSEEETQRLTEFRQALASVNDGLEKANPNLARTAQFVDYLGNTSARANAAVEQTQELLAQIPGISSDQLEAARALRFALVNPQTGQAPTNVQGLQTAIREGLRGLPLPSKAEAAALTANQVRAQLELNQRQGQLQRETIIPGQSFLRQLAAGRAPTGGQVSFPNPLTGGTTGLPAGVISQFGGNTSQLTEGLSQVATQANAGREALVGMLGTADNINRRAGISSNLLGSFEALTKAAGQTANTIRSISQASAWLQVNLQVKQINEQIYVMGRSLEDAKSFLSGVGAGELGILQHRARGLEISQAELGFRQQELGLLNQQLGLQAAALQLAQRQRQINFQRAIAGFVTPGQTPEEIAARQAEAELEANFAQQQQDLSVKQLDNQRESVGLAAQQLAISKEQFAVQQAMVDVSAERAIGDLTRAIGLLQEQARVTVQLQINSEAIDAYQAVLDEQTAQIQQVLEEAYNTQQTILSNSAALAAQYGGRLTEWNNLIISHLQDYLARAGAALGGAASYAGQRLSYTPGGPSGSSSGTSTNSAGFAPGGYMNVSSPTQLTVGEAGPETIAILRNPRSMTMQPNWGGGGVNITVVVTGNTIKDELDEEALANTIARKVEESMSRRSSLIGLRPN